MDKNPDFLKSVLDTISEHIAVIDKLGNIVFVNKGWVTFGNNNNCHQSTSSINWNGINYLDVCSKAAKSGDEFGGVAAKGIRDVINGNEDLFYFEYPCHSPNESRWFMMRITPLVLSDSKYYVISHQDITERKEAEMKALELSRLDGLTGIANRRHFDEFFESELKRCSRLNLPISLAIIDLDHFKLLNDTYGHQAGDDCLKSVGTLLKNFSKRPGDICARYGGEEFALVLANTNLRQSEVISTEILNSIHNLQIANKASPSEDVLTASIGLVSIKPDAKTNPREILELADKELYHAKANGRNQLCYANNEIETVKLK